MVNKIELCRCGSKLALEICCGKYLAGNALPETPEQLMRSRYTAFALNNVEYIGQTMMFANSGSFDATEVSADNKLLKWLKLDVIRHEYVDESNGVVEFKAYYRANGKKNCLHEVREFRKVAGKWFYINQS